jgi:predicted MFS family arabinose efflux permease
MNTKITETQLIAAKNDRMNPRILLLALGIFAIATEGFVIAGLLPTIAGDLGVAVAVAGQLITVFALTFALSAPLIASLTSTWPRRRLLIAGLAVFATANAIAALSPTFAVLLTARVLAAIGSALFTPTAVVAATTLAAPAQRGQAVAVVIAGSTFALVLGVPLGTWAGVQFGWRVTYGLVALLAALAALGCLAFLPQVSNPLRVNLRAWIGLVSQPRVGLGLGVTLLGLLGWFAVYIYIAPLLRQVTHLEGAAVGSMLLVYGLASIVGNLLGGYTADRWGPTRTVAFSLIGLAVTLAALPLLATSVAGAVAALIAWGVAGFMLGPAQQSRLIALAPTGAAVLVALNASATWLGIGGGAVLGGAVISAASPVLLGWVGAACQILALGLLYLGTHLAQPLPTGMPAAIPVAGSR